jgi:hypothetical protein
MMCICLMMCGTMSNRVFARVNGTAPMLQQWMSSTPKSSSPDKFGKSSPLLKGDRQARKEKLAQRQQEIMHAGSMQVDIPTSPLGGVEQRQLGMETQGPVAGGSWQSLQDVSQGSWSVHDANRRNAAYSSDRSSQDGGESLDVQAFTDAQRMRQELATDELTILQHHRHLLEEAKASPHLVPAPLLGEEAHFLKWVASRKDIGGGGDGGSKEESDKQMAAAAGLVLDALRYQNVRRASPCINNIPLKAMCAHGLFGLTGDRLCCALCSTKASLLPCALWRTASLCVV